MGRRAIAILGLPRGGLDRAALLASARAACPGLIDLRVARDHLEIDCADASGIPAAASALGAAVEEVVDLEGLEALPPEEALRRGLSLMAAGRFWEAHEALERAWGASSGPDRAALHFLISCCAAAVHEQRGSEEASLRVLARALDQPSPGPSALGGLAAELRPLCEGAARGGGLEGLLRSFAARHARPSGRA